MCKMAIKNGDGGSEVDLFSGVCLFVSLFVNTITSERVNLG